MMAIDYISKLPDDLLYEILYYVGFDDVVRTSCLSKRWRYLWASLPALYINVCEMLSLSDHRNIQGRDDVIKDTVLLRWRKRWRMVNLVNRLLRIRKEPIFDFLISFNPAGDKRHPAHVKRWLQMLQSRRVEHLTLDHSEGRFHSANICAEYRVPSEILHFEFLTRLSLSFCRLQLRVAYRECATFKSLRELELCHVFVTDKEFNKCILPSALLLTKLSVCECPRLTRVDVPPELLNLKSLIVNDCFRIDEIQAEAPYLESFNYSGQFIRISMNKIAPLTEVILHFRSDAAKCMPDNLLIGRPRHDLASIMKTLPLLFPRVEDLQLLVEGLKIMVPSKECIQGKLHPMSANLKAFTWYIASVHEVDFCYLIRILEICPILEKLTIIFIELIDGGFHLKKSYESIYDKSKKEIWVPPPDYSVRLDTIKNVEIFGFTAEKNHMEFIGFLLKNCSLLEKMTVHPNRNINSWSEEIHSTAFWYIFCCYLKAQVKILSSVVASPLFRRVVFLPLHIQPKFTDMLPRPYPFSIWF